MKLGDVASILTGIVVKRKQADLADDTIKKYNILTLKSFDYDGLLNTNELDSFDSMEMIDDKYLTKKGDTIIRLSYPNTAISIKNEIGLLIPSLFAVIRLMSKSILPEYLALYLNSDAMRKFYSINSVGSVVKIVKTSALRDIELDVPEIMRQKKVVELYDLMIKEKRLYEDLKNEKAKYNNEIIKRLLSGGSANGN